MEDGVSGLQVLPGEVKPLAAAIRTLLEDPNRCRSMGEAGARRIPERFSWKRTAEETLHLYQRVLAGRGAGGTDIRPAELNAAS